jgi:hypothetical protein
MNRNTVSVASSVVMPALVRRPMMAIIAAMSARTRRSHRHASRQ